MTDPLQTSSKLSRNIPFFNFFFIKSLIIKISKASQMNKICANSVRANEFESLKYI